jgi:hypothetical protein
MIGCPAWEPEDHLELSVGHGFLPGHRRLTRALGPCSPTAGTEGNGVRQAGRSRLLTVLGSRCLAVGVDAARLIQVGGVAHGKIAWRCDPGAAIAGIGTQ